MNILFLMGVYPNYGGVEKVSTILANAFIEKGYGVGIVSFEHPHPDLAEKELSKQVSLYSLDFPVYSKTNIRKLHQIITDNRYDIIINQWCVPFYVARLCYKAMKGTHCKMVSVHHNKPDTNARIQDLEIKIENGEHAILNRIKLAAVKLVSRASLRYTYGKSYEYIVLSPSFIDVAKRFMFLHQSSKISSLSNPLTIEEAKDDVLHHKQKIVVCVGRIEYNQKRTFRVARIWKHIEKNHPDWKLVFVGDGPNRKDLENLCSELELKNVKISGFVNPIPYYKSASILIMASQYEGLPLVIVEGQSYGVVPVVLGSYEAVYDIITTGENGIISEMPYNENGMVKDLDCLMADEAKLKVMAENSIENTKRYSLPAIVEEWENLFKVVN